MFLVGRERRCARARRALSLALDGEAAPAEIHALTLHIGGCEPCRLFTTQVSAITRLIRTGRIEPATRGARS
jgi:predicted anti-sigma-YlaC factor YlaD